MTNDGRPRPAEKDIEEFIRSHPKGHFAQSEAWGRVKHNWERYTVCHTGADGKIDGAAAFLARKLPGLPWRLMYAPRGPVCDPGDLETAAALIEEARKLADRVGGYEIKMDPDIPAGNEAFKALMKREGFTLSSGKNFDSVQPVFVFRLDISGKSEQEIFDGFAAKTRYNIRLAVKKGVEVSVGGERDLDEFARLMEITGERDGFATRPESYFRRLLKEMGDCARLYAARLDGRMIAGAIAISYGRKTWYLYGASDNEYRNTMPNYLLQWEMIKWAAGRGSEIYDFRGVSGDLSPDNPLYGLYRFKKGFSGELVEFCGEFSLVTRPRVKRLADLMIRLVHVLGKIGK